MLPAYYASSCFTLMPLPLFTSFYLHICRYASSRHCYRVCRYWYVSPDVTLCWRYTCFIPLFRCYYIIIDYYFLMLMLFSMLPPLHWYAIYALLYCHTLLFHAVSCLMIIRVYYWCFIIFHLLMPIIMPCCYFTLLLLPLSPVAFAIILLVFLCWYCLFFFFFSCSRSFLICCLLLPIHAYYSCHISMILCRLFDAILFRLFCFHITRCRFFICFFIYMPLISPAPYFATYAIRFCFPICCVHYYIFTIVEPLRSMLSFHCLMPPLAPTFISSLRLMLLAIMLMFFFRSPPRRYAHCRFRPIILSAHAIFAFFRHAFSIFFRFARLRYWSFRCSFSPLSFRPFTAFAAPFTAAFRHYWCCCFDTPRYFFLMFDDMRRHTDAWRARARASVCFDVSSVTACCLLFLLYVMLFDAARLRASPLVCSIFFAFVDAPRQLCLTPRRACAYVEAMALFSRQARAR